MFLAGPPFNADAGLASAFMRAFAQASRDGADHALQHHQATFGQTPAPPQDLPPEPPTLTEAEYLLLFRDSLLKGVQGMTPEHLVLMGKGVTECTLEGWQQLSDPEKDIMREVFCPDAAPKAAAQGEIYPDGEEPLPSDESARRVVEAMRAGTLSATTLEPPPPPPSTAVEPPVSVVATSTEEPGMPGSAPERLRPQASPEGLAGLVNGTETTTTAQAAVAKESITS
jgi:hypothetical protein